MAFLASGSEHTMTVSARAILAYLQLERKNHEDWQRVIYSLGKVWKSE